MWQKFIELIKNYLKKNFLYTWKRIILFRNIKIILFPNIKKKFSFGSKSLKKISKDKERSYRRYDNKIKKTGQNRKIEFGKKESKIPK